MQAHYCRIIHAGTRLRRESNVKSWQADGSEIKYEENETLHSILIKEMDNFQDIVKETAKDKYKKTIELNVIFSNVCHIIKIAFESVGDVILVDIIDGDKVYAVKFLAYSITAGLYIDLCKN